MHIYIYNYTTTFSHVAIVVAVSFNSNRCSPSIHKKQSNIFLIDNPICQPLDKQMGPQQILSVTH